MITLEDGRVIYGDIPQASELQCIGIECNRLRYAPGNRGDKIPVCTFKTRQEGTLYNLLNLILEECGDLIPEGCPEYDDSLKLYGALREAGRSGLLINVLSQYKFPDDHTEGQE